MAKYMDSGGLSHFMGMLKDKYGEPEAPYTEVEWVESNGKQFVYLDWKPKIATWGFEADFIVRNAFSTNGGAWRSDTNANGFGNVFGTRNASGVNDIQLTTYGSYGSLRNGSFSYTTSGLFKTDKTRQQISYHGTSLKRGDGTTVTFSSRAESPNKYYTNMVVFAMHEGLRRSGYGNPVQPGSVRIYSLKFYDSDVLECDLVGAIRKSDRVTGLYDKVAGKFYPAPECTHGNIVGDLGEPEALVSSIDSTVPIAYAYNASDTRMLRAEVPTLSKLEDGQQISLTYLYAIGASYQTTELAGWDDKGNNNYVYVKLTLADGSQTEWIPCFYNGPTRLTTHYYAGHPFLLTYRENVFIGATATGVGNGAFMRGFWCDPNYNTDDVYTRYSDTLIAGLNGVKRYSLNMRDANGNWTSIMNQDNNVNATGKTAYTGGLMLGNVLYHNSSANIAAGGNTGQMKESQGGVDFRYDVNGITNAASTELQLRKPIYLVGTVGSDGLFYLDTTKWWTQTPDQTGKVYVQLGTAYNSYYAIFLSVDNPSFIYDGTKLVSYTPGNIGGTASNVTGTVAIANGGTGATTAAAAWTALGGGAIGKKASLAASDIPNLSTDKLTSGTLGVARGGTGKATHTSNAVLTGNGTSAVNNVATASGALYATATNGAPSFGTLPIAQGGTGKTTAADAWTALGGGAIGKKASLAASDIPSHASTATTYGAASTSNYGHAKLSSATNSSSETLAATPKAVKAAYDKASDALAGVATLTSTVTSDYYFKVTYSISNGTTTCAAHVYSAGAEVTSTFADSCFQWYYDIGSGWVSLGTGKTKAVTTLSDFGGNVKCDFTPPSS